MQEQEMMVQEGLRDEDAMAFVRAHPGVDPQQIPEMVWELVRDGMSLMEAYGQYEVQRVMEDNQQLKQQVEALQGQLGIRQRSLGSVRSVGKDRVADGFLRGFDEA